jgi:crotonobetainyl-CoA:carnitine CoA-transferase CaiB-like acyl-CoA transferase
MILSDLGARVLKVEDTEGGDFVRWSAPVTHGVGAMFAALNRDKLGLAINLKTESGKKIILELAERSEVVVESFRPGVLERLELGFDQLREVNPKVILCSISGHGQDGPYAQRPGHDVNYQGLAGVLNAHPEGPRVPGILIGDLVGGALWPALAVLAALLKVRGGGGAVHLDLSMTEGAMAMLIPDLSGPLDETPAADRFLKGPFAGYNLYRTADGKMLSVGALEPKFWLGLCQKLGVECRADDLGASEDRQEELKKQLAERIATRTAEEWAKELADFCCEPILDRAELARHPQHVHRKVFFEVGDDASGRFPVTRTPVGTDTGHTPPPLHGQHTRQILEELGYDDNAIQAMVEEGAIKI